MKTLEQLLNAYKTSNTKENEHKKTMLEFAARNSNCFERSCLEGHFTASAFLLSQNRQRALLMLHSKLDQWLQLGGHCDGDKDFIRVALKEAQEESGIDKIILLQKGIFDIDIHEIPANIKEPKHLHLDLRFLLGTVDSDDLTLNNESKELRWFGKNEQLPTNSPSVIRLFEKWRLLS